MAEARAPALTGDGYLRAWQLVRVMQMHRAAARRLGDAATEWVEALASFTAVDEDRGLLQARVAAERPPSDEEDPWETTR